MKLVTYDDGKVGRIEGEEIVRLDVPDMRDVLRARRRGRHDRAHAARRREAARADRPEEVLPHRRQLPRARGRVEERRLVARDRAVDHLLPERRRDHRPRRADHLPRAPDRGARLRARARRRPEARPGKWFSPEEAADYIGGYVIFNDITARDIQRARDALRRLLASARRSTRSARSARGSSRPTRSPTRTTWRCSCA